MPPSAIFRVISYRSSLKICLIDATGGEERFAGEWWQERKSKSARKLLWRLTRAVRRLGSAAPMITLTPRAAQQVRSMQAENNVPQKRLRVLIESGGCSGFQYGMSFDEPKPDDAEFTSEGVAIVIDPASLAYLNGSSIDFDDGLHGKGFEIKNPNAQSTCGCGKSFS